MIARELPLRGGGHALTTNEEPRVGRKRTINEDPPARLRRKLIHRVFELFMVLHRCALQLGRAIGGPARPPGCGRGVRILLTGTFFSENWITAHIKPLAASRACSCLWVVTTFPIPQTPKIIAVYPPQMLVRCLGRVPARLLVFAWTALRVRPHVVGGFHLLINSLVAAVMARLVGAKAMYFCVGGPMEVLDGGIWGESKLFAKMETPNPVVERQLIESVKAFDLVVTMGTRAIDYYHRQGIDCNFQVVSGGIDNSRFHHSNEPATFDLILVGRLTEIKRIDVFLLAVHETAKRIPGVTAVIVGDGELRESLERMARELRIDGQVRFVGHQSRVDDWLRKARLFVLTSDSEGLALALMEAMTCGLPAVVSRVGDLEDLVVDGVNGFLVERRQPVQFAERITELLSSPPKLEAFSRAARESSRCYESISVSRKWDRILTDLW